MHPRRVFGRDGGFEFDSFPGTRMVETEPPGVEHEAARSGFLAFGVGVDGIADERVAQVQHVDADLVRASGVEGTKDEG